ncbi:PmeII family type II restriction endonuclease [Brevibacillus sp. NPDC003359]|uniref:PmeII family type II restriction endonuclease n=1 Tax=unclassified Brevibacillus TaxID=2684853 RepID=UPI0036A6BD78
MNIDQIEKLISELLDNFYRRRIEKITTLKLKDTLARKNPYLYKSLGIEKASDIVEEILKAYMSSSDEGIFGDAFFEPLAEIVSGGHVGDTEGVDVIIEDKSNHKAIAVKSGTNVFNADSRKKQAENFAKLRARIAKRGKLFDAIVGYGYGKKETDLNKQGFRELAGQVFWEEITGDEYFYLKIIHLIKEKPLQHLPEYHKEFNAAVNRFTFEFMREFCNEDGTINWEKLVKFNSGRPCKKLYVEEPKSTKTLSVGEKYQIKASVSFNNDEILEVTGSPEITYEVNSENILNVTESGIVHFHENVEPGTEVKVVISCYGKNNTRIFKLKK